MNDLDWTPQLFTVFTIQPEDPKVPEGRLITKAVADCEGFPNADESFIDQLDKRIRSLVKKKPDTAPAAACKVYGFSEGDGGESDRNLLEEELLLATDRKKFRFHATRIMDRLLEIPGIRPGLVVICRVMLSSEEIAEAGVPAIFLLWSDFQGAESLDLAEGLDLKDIPLVLDRSIGRALMYPRLDVDGIRHDLVKMHCRPATHPFVCLLNLVPPPTTDELLQKEVYRAICARGDDARTRYKDYFAKKPPKKRELFGEERLVKQADLMPAREAAAIARESSRTSHDLYSKKQSLKITIDGQVTVDLRLEDLNESFFFGKRGGEKYIVIRGKSFQANKAQLGPLDLLEPESSLGELLDRVVE